MEQESSKEDSEKAAIKGSKTSPGSQMKKMFHEVENDQLWQMMLIDEGIWKLRIDIEFGNVQGT